MSRRTAAAASLVLGSLWLAGACSSSDSTVNPGSTAGASGDGGSGPDASAGSAGQAMSGGGGQPGAGGGSAGSSGTAGNAGNAGTGGSGGSSGNAGTAGDAQTGGAAGAGMAGEAGAAGASCVDFSVQATQSSAALLLMLDASGSMTTQSKWSTVQASVVSALDQNLFDGLTLGAGRYPTNYTDPPACICDQICACSGATCSSMLGIPGLACGANAPSVVLSAAGTDKSSAASGARHSIYQFLSTTTPLSSNDDGSPAYGALNAGISALSQATAKNRVLLWITDGSPNCTSVANPMRPGYLDGNGCGDWEEPSALSTLVNGAATATTPVRTFVIGLPGSDSTGAANGTFSTAPYSMELALSTIAVAGAPDFVDPSCDSSLVFSKTGPAPAKPCHRDLARGSFSIAALTSAINAIGAEALGCVFDLPQAPAGKTIDPLKTNVVVAVGGAPMIIPKRSAASDTCLDGVGCWDTLGSSQFVLRGAACPALASPATLSVDLQFGCSTVLR